MMHNTALKVPHPSASPVTARRDPHHRPARTPKVSVILPVYNTERYLEAAVRSILDQTFKDFELIVVDDGSTDTSGMILDWLAMQDDRILILRQTNAGVTRALNAGLALARGHYIARMDSDDIAQPDRFALQVAALDARPEVVALGTQFCLIDKAGRRLKRVPVPVGHADLDARLSAQQDLSICHPSVMMRADALREVGGYDDSFKSAQDIDLFLRLAEVGELANLEDELMSYRIHTESTGYKDRPTQMQNAWTAGKRAAERRNRAFKTAKPTPSEGRRSAASNFRMWGWWALGEGQITTARRYALRAVLANPLSGSNWKLAVMSVRGY